MLNLLLTKAKLESMSEILGYLEGFLRLRFAWDEGLLLGFRLGREFLLQGYKGVRKYFILKWNLYKHLAKTHQNLDPVNPYNLDQ